MRFTEHGGVTISAENNQAGEILFCVADTGVGISQETMSKIFEPFQRVIVDDWRQREGFGLGVPISKRFVELHGGRMWVESELSVGTRFYFTLPVSAAANQPRALLDGDLEQRDAHYWQQLQDKARSESLIMVLSPDPTAGDVIAPYVEDYGVVCVQNPAEVVPKVEEVLPSALFVDQRIAAEQAVVALVGRLAYDLPVVTFSFPGHPAHPQHLPEYVANYLVKPVDTDTLTSAVSAMGPGVRDLLIVDDDPAMLRFVQRALAAPGDGESRLAGSDGEGRPGTAAPYRLVTASTGERAIAAIRQDHPDLVLLDLALPDISGWEVLKEAQKGKTPVIIVTAQDWRLTPVAGGQDTLRLTLPRPLKHQELQGVLNGLLGSIHPSYAERLGAPARPAIAPGQTVS
jgi:CheY-like chemotaxis protein